MFDDYCGLVEKSPILVYGRGFGMDKNYNPRVTQGLADIDLHT